MKIKLAVFFFILIYIKFFPNSILLKNNEFIFQINSSYSLELHNLNGEVSLLVPLFNISLYNLQYNFNIKNSIEYNKNFVSDILYNHLLNFNFNLISIGMSIDNKNLFPTHLNSINFYAKYNGNIFNPYLFLDYALSSQHKIGCGIEYIFKREKKKENNIGLKFFTLDDITLLKIPYDAEIVEKNLSIISRIKELKEKNILIVFNGMSTGGRILIDDNFNQAFKDVQQKISMFLKTKVFVLEKSNSLDNTRYNTYKKFFLSISDEIQYGTIIIGKYYIDLPLGLREYHVIAIYDPYLFFKLIKENNKYNEIKKTISLDEILNYTIEKLKEEGE
ncbi:hypothetical protein X275_00685 [Marinitoga sp. 1197]|uniref:hypothetical protein n=1 Tax=Marinitoga sp. 1197 TaxID=1428449 RepID=UPI000640F7F7|nr:hypothetical protein [Marinitoga sp. 1197]KLO24233.1 hypothetical protein X275_00685 [Marinitoga sp. 1197]